MFFRLYIYDKIKLYAIIKIMNMKRKIIIANWKTNITAEKDAVNLFNSIKAVMARMRNVEMMVCPPHMYLNQVSQQAISDHYGVAAQDAYPDEAGSQTGSTTVQMVKNAGAKYVLLGHSDRAHLEDRGDVAKKITAVLEAEMKPIICIGEHERDKNWKKELTQQLKDSFYRVPKKNADQIVIAYEPIWAISSDKKNPASADQYNEAMTHIKKELQKIFKTLKAVEQITFLYGGSLDDKNIEEYLRHTDVDGFLVGRVSHDPRILMTMFRLIDEDVEKKEREAIEAMLEQQN